MPTQTQTEYQEFTPTEARPLPTLICVGRVTDVGDAKVSASQNYIVQPISLEACDTGRNIKVYWLYRPEWLDYAFNPANMLKQEGGKAAHFVYGKNIASRDNLSVLRGLSGSKEVYGKVCAALVALPKAGDTGGPSMEDVTNVLREHLVSDTLVGYILEQQLSDTGEVDEDGKKIKIRDNRYQVASYWDVNAAACKRMEEKAERSGGDVKYTFDGNNIPF